MIWTSILNNLEHKYNENYNKWLKQWDKTCGNIPIVNQSMLWRSPKLLKITNINFSRIKWKGFKTPSNKLKETKPGSYK